MLRSAIRVLVLAFGLSAGGAAQAAFHLWSMAELFSNADGTVQYLEMVALTGGQQFVGGHTLTSTPTGGAARTFSFPTNLPGNTSGKRMLIATQGYAALGDVTPDYIVPNDFFSRTGGTINFGEGSDIWQHPAPPLDGSRSLGREGSTAVASPTNFAGDVSRGPVTFQGLWYNSPAESEQGWGVNLTHQGSILFATWFTYDANGDGIWLVMANGVRTGVDTFTGPLLRTTGPPFNAVPFNPANVANTTVGSATFSFISFNEGSFTYTLNGVTQTKPIVRQIYSAPVSLCTTGGPASTVPDYQDLWWGAPAGSESGWGVNITHQGDILFATWFTYAADGRGQWLVMSNLARTTPTSNTYVGTIFRTSGPAFSTVPWNNAQFVANIAGTASFTFPTPQTGTFTYTLDGTTMTKQIVRQVFQTPVSVCRTMQ